MPKGMIRSANVMSFANLVWILPAGFESKNSIVALAILWTMASCSPFALVNVIMKIIYSLNIVKIM